MREFKCKEPADILAQYFSSKFNDEHFSYENKNGSIARYPLNKDGSKIKTFEQSYSGSEITVFDKCYRIAFILSASDSRWGSHNKIPFYLCEDEIGKKKPIKFKHLYDFHSNEFLIRIRKHLKLINEAHNMHRKRELIEFESNTLQVRCFYRYDSIGNTVGRCATLYFKEFNGHTAKEIVILDDDNKFLAAIDEMEAEFQRRYYDHIIHRDKIERGKFISKRDQQLIKMAYF
jgi:hypothetical protein